MRNCALSYKQLNNMPGTFLIIVCFQPTLELAEANLCGTKRCSLACGYRKVFYSFGVVVISITSSVKMQKTRSPKREHNTHSFIVRLGKTGRTFHAVLCTRCVYAHRNAIAPFGAVRSTRVQQWLGVREQSMHEREAHSMDG